MINGNRFVLMLAMLLQAVLVSAQEPSVRVDPQSDGFAALSVPDIAASTAWYQQHFGLTKGFSHSADDRSVQIVVLSRPGLTIELQQHASAQQLQPASGKTFLRYGIFKFGVTVSDVRDAVLKLASAGVVILVQPFEDQGGRYLSAIVTDNSGNVIQLFQKIAVPSQAKQ